MKKLLLPLLATAALAAPAAASAHHGHGKHLRFFGRHHHALLAKVTGTGTSFASASATASGTIAKSNKLGTGTFAAAITNDTSKATTHTGSRGTLTCMPSTAALTLTGSNTADTTHATLTGKTCTWTPTGKPAVSAFFGRGPVTGTGALASLTGNEKAFLFQKADGSVRGAVFAGSRGMFLDQFMAGRRDAEHKTGNCGDH